MRAWPVGSVRSQIRLPDTEPTRTGGHLVLVTGHADGLVTFHDPAGHTPQAGVATLAMPVFDRFAVHRGVALSPATPGVRSFRVGEGVRDERWHILGGNHRRG